MTVPIYCLNCGYEVRKDMGGWYHPANMESICPNAPRAVPGLP